MQTLAIPFLALSALAAAPFGQNQIELLPTSSSASPISPGAMISVLLNNGSTDSIPYSFDDCALRILRPTGELIRTPALPATGCALSGALAPGQVVEIVFQAPDEPGAYALLYPYGTRAVLRLDVGGVDPGAAQIVAYPSNALFIESTHQQDFLHPDDTPWEFANLGAVDHTFGSAGAGDRIGIFTPGGKTPLVTQPLDSLTVKAGQVLQVELDTGALAPGPYTVKTQHTDPVAGAVTLSHGVRDVGSGIDLHLIDGHSVPNGGGIHLAVAVSDFSSAPLYAVLLGVLPGSTPFPSGFDLPLVLDGLVISSLTGLGGLLQNNIGTVPAATGAFADITLLSPGIPELVGLEVRAAAVAVTGSIFWTSQPELIRLD